MHEVKQDELFYMGINSTVRNSEIAYNYITLKFMFDCGLYCGQQYRALEYTAQNDADLIGIEFEKLFNPIPIHKTFDNSLICEKKLLQKLHAKFDGDIWESVEFDTFLDFMRVGPIGQIKIIKRKNKNKIFAQWLRDNIEFNRDENLVPNFGNWFKKLIDKNINYSSQFQE